MGEGGHNRCAAVPPACCCTLATAGVDTLAEVPVHRRPTPVASVAQIPGVGVLSSETPAAAHAMSYRGGLHAASCMRHLVRSGGTRGVG